MVKATKPLLMDLKAVSSCCIEISVNPQLPGRWEISLKTSKYMYTIEASGIKHAKPLACSSSPAVSAHSHHAFTLCALELMHSGHAVRLFQC